MKSLTLLVLSAVVILFSGPGGPGLRATEQKAVKVEFRRAESEPAKGLKEAKVEGRNEKVYLHDKAELTNEDIASANVEEVELRGVALEFRFTRAGQKKLAKLTEEHLNKPLAILVDGSVIAAPIIRSKLTDRAVISGKFKRAELERIAKSLNEK